MRRLSSFRRLLLLAALTLLATASGVQGQPVDALTPPRASELAIINEALDYCRTTRERPDGIRVRQASPAEFRVGERARGSETLVFATDQNGRITHLQNIMGFKTLREFEILMRLRHITWLITSHARLPPGDRVPVMNLVAQLPELQGLRMTDGQGWTGLHFAPLARAERLRMLDLDAGERFINYANFNLSAPNLEYFRCERCYLMDIGAQSLSLSPSLQELQIPGNNIGPEGARWLASMPNLKVLNLRNNRILDEGARNLSASRSIETLDLSAIAGQGLTARGLADLAHISTLRRIDLDRNDFGNDGVRALVEGRPELQRLGLSDTGINDEALSLVRRLSDLRELSLGGNRLTGAALQQLEGMTSLRVLALNWSSIGAGNLRFLQTLPALEELGIKGTRIADEDCVC